MSVELDTARPVNFDIPLWRLTTVLAYVPVSQSTWLSGVARGNMPKPVKIPGTSAVVWRSVDIREWVERLESALEPSKAYFEQEAHTNSFNEVSRINSTKIAASTECDGVQ